MSEPLCPSPGGGSTPANGLRPAAGPGRPGRTPAIVLALAIIVMGGLGTWQIRELKRSAREAAVAELEAVADLKTDQIVRWMRERLADARLVRATPYATRRALDVIRDRESSTTRIMFTGWLDGLLDSGFYSRVILLEGGLEPVLIHPPQPAWGVCPEVLVVARRAMEGQDIEWADLHAGGGAGEAHLSFAVPLVVRVRGDVPAAGLPVQPGDRSDGVLVLEAGADDLLTPLMRSWPTPSRTAETYLVRREDEGVLFLHDVRHRGQTALSLRVPITETDRVAVRAVQAGAGWVEGIDYRGVAVLAAVRAVPGTPWWIVAKKDRAEIEAGWRRQALVAGGGLAGLTAALVLGVVLAWRRSQEEFLREQLRAKEALVESERAYHEIFNLTNEAIFLDDAATGRVLDVNEPMLRLYGYESKAEVLAGNIGDLSANEPPHTEAEAQRRIRLAIEEGPQVFEWLARRKDGERFWVEVSLRSSELKGQGRILAVVRDITQRKQAEAERERQAEELRIHSEELARFNRVAVGRELRMIELKEEVNGFCRRLGKPPKYEICRDGDDLPGR